MELEADELLSVPPGPEEEIDLSVDFDVVAPAAREAPFSDVTPMWSSLDVGKLASPLFAATAWQPTAGESRAHASWHELRARVETALHRYRAWWIGGAIAMAGAFGTCALVTAVRSPKAEGANAAIVAPRPSEPPSDAPEAPAPSDEQIVTNAALPVDAVATRSPRKGSTREKVDPPPSRAPATRTATRGAEATANRAPAPPRETPLPASPPAAAPRVEPSQVASPSFPGVDAAEEFNRTAAMEAMRKAGDGSRSCMTGGASGGARVAVTFVRSGSASDVGVEGSFAGTPVGNCIAAKFRALRIPPFRGSSVTVRRTLSF